MKIATKEQKYKCTVCKNNFILNDETFLQLNKAYCSLFCLTKAEFETTPEIIRWVVKQYWLGNMYTLKQIKEQNDKI